MESGGLWWMQYQTWTQRTWRLFGAVPVWSIRVDVEDKPWGDLIHKAFGVRHSNALLYSTGAP